MKPYEYQMALQIMIDNAMLVRERNAYQTAMRMFMMVEYPDPASPAEMLVDEYPKEKAERAENGSKADTKDNTAQAAGEGVDSQVKAEDCSLQAAGGGKTQVKDENSNAQAAGEKPKKKSTYKMKICRNCGKEFRPSYGPQSMCINCAGKIADRRIKTEKKKPDNREAEEIAEKLTGGIADIL